MFALAILKGAILMCNIHDNSPLPFNKEYRPGLGEKISERYGKYCEDHPDATQAQRKLFYGFIAEKLKPDFPKWHRV